MRIGHGLLLVAMGLTACTGLAPGGQPQPGVSASPSLPPPTPLTITTSPANVTAQWSIGTVGSPPEAPLLTCGDDGLWSLQQHTGTGTVTGSRTYRDWTIKVSPLPPPNLLEVVWGTNVGGRLHLQGRVMRISDLPASDAASVPASDVAGMPVSYDLTYDATTHQLKGTRNHESFWAVPTVQGKAHWPEWRQGVAPPYPQCY